MRKLDQLQSKISLELSVIGDKPIFLWKEGDQFKNVMLKMENPMGSENVKKVVICIENLYHLQVWESPLPPVMPLADTAYERILV